MHSYYNISKTILPVILLLIALNSYAQIERLETAFIFQFTKLIEWCPMGKEGDFNIVLLGDSPDLKAELVKLQNRKGTNQNIQIKNVQKISEIGYCQILIIPESNTQELINAVAFIDNKCTLIICEKSGTAELGAAISFNLTSGKLQYEINQTFMSKHQFVVNDQLIKLAKTIYY